MDATDLTQLSSREQLSALMDGALPPDETRFLLRRLQHDESLAQCWERWRLSAEVMRGLAPAQRLPGDFASRVAALLRAENGYPAATIEAVATAGNVSRSPAWLRWGGGAAVAASLAVVALMNQPAVVGSPGNLPDNAVVAVGEMPPLPATKAIIALSQTQPPRSPAQDPASAGLESQVAALAIAAVARPSRNNRRGNSARGIQFTPTQVSSMLASTSDVQPAEFGSTGAANIQPLMPPADINVRPWPRSVLPQYGNAGITVGFGNSVGNATPHNPFQVRSTIGNLPPALSASPPAREATPPANDESANAVNGVPQS